MVDPTRFDASHKRKMRKFALRMRKMSCFGSIAGVTPFPQPCKIWVFVTKLMWPYKPQGVEKLGSVGV